MKNPVAIIHFNSWYIHVSRQDDDMLQCWKYDSVTHDLEVAYFDNALDASDWVLEPVQAVAPVEITEFKTQNGQLHLSI